MTTTTGPRLAAPTITDCAQCGCESWAHFRQGRADLEAAFKALGVEDRLRFLEPGVPTDVAAD
jgi:hypothetical protein